MAKSSRRELLDAVVENTSEARKRRGVAEAMLDFLKKRGGATKVSVEAHIAFTELLGTSWHQPHTWGDISPKNLEAVSALIKKYKK